jgi:hypothetical protein
MRRIMQGLQMIAMPREGSISDERERDREADLFVTAEVAVRFLPDGRR